VRVRGSQGNSGRKGPQRDVTATQPPPSEWDQPICHLPSPFPSSAPSQLTLRSRLSRSRCSRTSRSVQLLSSPRSENRCWAAGGHVVAGGERCLQQLPLLRCHEHDLKILCKTPAVFNTGDQKVLKMKNTVLLNVLNMAQCSILIDSI